MPEGIFGPDLAADQEEPQAQDEEPEAEEAAGQPEPAQEGEGEQAEGPAEGAEGEPGPSEQQATGGEDWTLGGRFKKPEDLAKSYRELERLLGRHGQELGALRQQVAQYQAILAQYQQALAQAGQYVGQGQPAAAPQVAAPHPPSQSVQAAEDEDPQKWIDQLYAEGPRAVDKRVEAKLRRELEEHRRWIAEQLARIEQAAKQAITPIQRFAQEEAIRTWLEQQEAALRNELSQQGLNLDDYADDVVAVIREDPSLLSTREPLRRAFEVALARKMAKMASSQATQAAKKVARMPSSTGSRPSPPKSDEDRIRAEVFGGGEEAKGIFG